MIEFKTLKWDRVFSYGANNEITFDNPLVQLLGKNGHGKSSIPLILEEVLYNKNSKGIKKSDILNRYSTDKSYRISVTFIKDNDEYIVTLNRTTAQSIKLLKNGEDISAHTATNTYKLIENIIGIDHKTFSQIVYQSSPNSLEFLTATDSARKKFLIDLLNLSKYIQWSDYFKSLLKETNIQLETELAKKASLTTMLKKLDAEDIVKKELISIPDQPDGLRAELAALIEKLNNIVSINKKVRQNNIYKNMLDSIQLTPVENSGIDINNLATEKALLDSILLRINNQIREYSGLKPVCSECKRPIDISDKLAYLKKLNEEKSSLLENICNAEAVLAKNKAVALEFNKYQERLTEYEKIYALYDPSIRIELLDEQQLLNDKKNLTNKIAAIESEITSAINYNAKVTASNTRIDVISSQKVIFTNDIEEINKTLNIIQKKVTTLQILVKVFSSSGLVAYKIEYMVKELEELTNKYLGEMSDGRFQLFFEVSDSDKLNVVIVDNGIQIDISNLSNGERARVNVSALLAIRGLLQKISNSKINLLILDETIDSLDSDGKEKLIEVLLSEKYLNTILISHGFTHPLLEKINVIKTNNISRIE